MQKKLVDLLAKRCRENANKIHAISCSDTYCELHRIECYGSTAQYLVDNGVICTNNPEGGGERK